MAVQQNILIVDDSLLARVMLKRFVSKSLPDAHIIEGKDGSDALSKIDGKCIDIAFVDYNMPGISGIELARMLKERQPNVVISLITANIQDYIIKEASVLGIDFIPKPIDEHNIAVYLQKRGF